MTGSSESNGTRVVSVYARDGGPGFLQPITIAPSTETNWDEGIRRPIADLDSDNRESPHSLFSILYPHAESARCTAITYEYKAPDTDKHSKSHLLIVLLGVYAAVADLRLGTTSFSDSLEEWSASSWPDKGGALQSVGNLNLKLKALFDGDSTAGKETIRRLLLSAADRPIVEQLLIPEISHLGFEPGNSTWHGNGVTLSHQEGGENPWLEIVFVSTWTEALEGVFGSALLVRYARARWWDRARVPLVLGLIGFAAFGAYVRQQYTQTITYRTETTIGTHPHVLVGTKPSGKQAFRHQFTVGVREMLSVNLDGKGRDEVVVGLAHSNNTEHNEFLPGSVIAFDGFGNLLWDSRVTQTVYHMRGEFTNAIGVDHLELIKRGNGETILVSIHNSDTFFPCVVRGFALNGEVRFEFAHPGRLYDLHAFGPNLVAFVGNVNRPPGKRGLQECGVIFDGKKYGDCLLAVEIETLVERYSANVAAQKDHTGAAAEEAPYVWYYALSSSDDDFHYIDGLKRQTDGSFIVQTMSFMLFQVQQDGSFVSFSSLSRKATKPDLTLIDLLD